MRERSGIGGAVRGQAKRREVSFARRDKRPLGVWESSFASDPNIQRRTEGSKLL